MSQVQKKKSKSLFVTEETSEESGRGMKERSNAVSSGGLADNRIVTGREKRAGSLFCMRDAHLFAVGFESH